MFFLVCTEKAYTPLYVWTQIGMMLRINQNKLPAGLTWLIEVVRRVNELVDKQYYSCYVGILC